MIEAKDIQLYKDKTIPQLLKIAETHFNKFIRERDKHFKCISCQKGEPEQAGHFYSAGNYSALRFNEWNVNGQCGFYCNKMRSGNVHEYRKNLILKIGIKKVELLDQHAHDKVKWDRFTLIELIVRYRKLNLKNK